jgi:hypothetical protein
MVPTPPPKRIDGEVAGVRLVSPISIRGHEELGVRLSSLCAIQKEAIATGH